MVFTDNSLLDMPGSLVIGDVDIWSLNEKTILSGPLEFVMDSRGSPVKQLNRILSSDIGWNCYEVRMERIAAFEVVDDEKARR